MSIQDILKETEKEGRKTVSKDDLVDFWRYQIELSKKAVDQILEKRKEAFSSETKIILG